jgi:hypothetical protein
VVKLVVAQNVDHRSFTKLFLNTVEAGGSHMNVAGQHYHVRIDRRELDRAKFQMKMTIGRAASMLF